VTLYYEQWVRLLDAADALRAFLGEEQRQIETQTELTHLCCGDASTRPATAISSLVLP
jgi:hypothetical protein